MSDKMGDNLKISVYATFRSTFQGADLYFVWMGRKTDEALHQLKGLG